ncbi:MAG: hypothetical protein WAO83_21950 [Fuerstiella sp.]
MSLSKIFPGGSTDFPIGLNSLDTSGEDRRATRHASVVLNRAIRSSQECDQILQERIYRAVNVLEKTNSTETALLNSRSGDVVLRLAARVVKAMCRATLGKFSERN